MTLDELIEKLQNLRGAHSGTLEVRFYTDNGRDGEIECDLDGAEFNDDDGTIILITGEPV